MVTPLYIIVMNSGQHLQYLVRSGSTVEDVTHHMDYINRQTVYKVRNLYQQIFRTACLNNTLNNRIEVIRPVMLNARFMQQLFYHVRKRRRQQLAHFRPRIFDRHRTSYFRHLVQTTTVPLRHSAYSFALILELQLPIVQVLNTLVWIVYQCTQRPFLCFRNSVSVDIVHFATHYT